MRNFELGSFIFGTGMAAGKTSPSLLHAREPQKPMFLQKKRACGNLEDLTMLITCQKPQEICVFDEKETPAAAGKTSPCLRSQMAFAIFVIGDSLGQFEL